MFHLTEQESHFIHNSDATSYWETLKELRESDLVTEKVKYKALQKKASKLWKATKLYRLFQKMSRTPAPPSAVMRLRGKIY